jgi:FtsZ-binding cell division protein ZapB
MGEEEMTLEEFKEEIENKYKSQMLGLEQQIKNRDYTIKLLKEEIINLKKHGCDLLTNAAEFKKLLSDFIEENSYKLPDLDYDWDETVRLFRKKEEGE